MFVCKIPVIPLPAIVQFGEQWSVMELTVFKLTPSIISMIEVKFIVRRRRFTNAPISPLFGQSGPKVQKAGQVPQPNGMWARSMTNKP